MKMVVEVPTAAYLGVAVRLEPPASERDGAVSITLEHRDPGLSLALYRANDGLDIVAEWQSWGRVLKLPLLVAEPDGRLREPFPRGGAAGAPPSADGDRGCRCGGGWDARLPRPSCIVANARSSRGTRARRMFPKVLGILRRLFPVRRAAPFIKAGKHVGAVAHAEK